MPGRIRRGFSRTPPSMRRKTVWIGSFDVTGMTTLAAGAAVLDQSFLATAQSPFTVTRTRGFVFVKSDQEANTETPFGALGMMVVRDPAAAAGVASVPTPITEEEDEGWFVWQPFVTDITVSSAIGIINGGTLYQFDSKAQRKMAQGDTLIVSLENGSATHGLQYLTKFRILLKIH